MTRRVSKHGTTYTVGSQSTYGGWEPRVCSNPACLYGGRIVKSHDHALWFHHDDLTGRAASWHMDCWRASKGKSLGAPTGAEVSEGGTSGEGA